MKLSKKLIACVLACILALSMLTACGGGGGGGTSASTLKLASAPLAAGTVTLEGTDATNSSNKVELSTNGTSTYVRETSTGSDEVCLKVNSSIYYIDLTAEEIEAENVSSDSTYKALMELMDAMLNVKDHLSGATSGKTTVNGVEYYSETTTAEISGTKFNFAYCFSGNTLKYIVIIDNSTSEVFLTIQVDSVKNSVDDSLLTVDGWTKTTPAPSETITVKVSGTPSNSGTMSGAGTYNVGDSVTLKATPKSGYVFKSWQKNGTTVSTSASYTFTASENCTLTAVFEKDTSVTVTIEASPAAGGTVSGGGTYTKGSSVTVKATPNTGYAVKGWQKNNVIVSTHASYTFTASENCTLTAVFEKGATFTVTASASPAAGGTVSGSGTYNVGNSVTLKATPNTGYTFKGWQENGSIVSTSTSYTFATFESVTLTALFEKDTVADGIPIDEAHFPDAIFRKFVSTEYDTDSNGYLSDKEIKRVKELHYALSSTFGYTSDLSDLTGIQYFTELQSLILYQTKLSSLDVSKNTKLKELNLTDNELKSLNVSNNSELTTLWVGENQITNLDVSHCPKLESLKCQSNSLTQLDVSKNPMLKELWCYDTNLMSLDVSKNPMMESLNCEECHLTSLTLQNPQMTYLRCDNNQLSSLDLSKNIALVSLSCSNNQLNDLAISQNVNLKTLYCENNRLTALNVTKCTKLEDLRCGNNNLTSLDVSKNPELWFLVCENNKLTVLDLSANPKFKSGDIGAVSVDDGVNVIYPT